MKTEMEPQRHEARAILGIGIDLVENERMGELLARWGSAFKRRVFLPEELAYCESKTVATLHFAARFAAKEAVAKAFGTGISKRLNWLDIEVLRAPETGAPSIRLSSRAALLAAERGVADILVSLAHTRLYSMAEAMLLGAIDGPRRDILP